jgi:enoyl-CoA hydratase
MTDDVSTRTQGHVGRITLNRPRAINALTLEMCEAISAALLEWRNSPAIEAVLIDHGEGRGFCAGGDVRAAVVHGADAARTFFHAEYRMNHLMFGYPKPIAVFMDGITMGGGAGLALPCRYRIATENTRFAMPEATIGLFPDVGAGWYLSRLPDRVGQFLALTAAQLDGAECIDLGLASHYLPSAALRGVKAAIASQPHYIDQLLRSSDVVAPPARIERNRPTIARLFASDRLEEILAALRTDGSEWAKKELQTIAGKSPTTCKVALRLLAHGAEMRDFTDEMRLEYAIAWHIAGGHDFPEGVRALLIDKDNAPVWDPATPAEVSDEMIDALFAPLPSEQQWMPFEGLGDHGYL